MSNKLINGVIALVEDRPEVARALLRSPELKGVSVSDVQVRLEVALENLKIKAVKQALRDVMSKTLRLSSTEEAFLQGVVAVESILEQAIEDLES